MFKSVSSIASLAVSMSMSMIKKSEGALPKAQSEAARQMVAHRPSTEQGNQTARSMFTKVSDGLASQLDKDSKSKIPSSNRDITTLANRRMTPESARTPTPEPANGGPKLHTFLHSFQAFIQDNPNYVPEDAILDQSIDISTGVHVVVLCDPKQKDTPREMLAFGVDATSHEKLTAAVTLASSLSGEDAEEIFDAVFVKNMVVSEDDPSKNVDAHIDTFNAIENTAQILMVETPKLSIFSHQLNPKLPIHELKDAATDMGIEVNAQDLRSRYPDLQEQFDNVSVSSFSGDCNTDKSLDHKTNITTLSTQNS